MIENINVSEELKAQFFVNRESFEKENISKYLEILVTYCKIDNSSGSGTIYFTSDALSLIKKITIGLIARYIGHQFDENIPESVSVNELSKATGHRESVVSARLTELVGAKIAKRFSKGLYSIEPYYIQKFLFGLKNKDVSDFGSKIRQIKKTGVKQKTKSTASVNSIEPDIDKNFIKNVVEKIDKSRHIYIYDLPNWQVKALAILKLARNDLEIDGLTTAQIYWIIKGRFRIRVSWTTISSQLSLADKKGYTDSTAKSDHPRAARVYKILNDGEEKVKKEIEKIKQ